MKEPKAPLHPAWGYLFVLTAAILWAVCGSAAKYLFLHGVTPFQVVQLRLTIGAGVLLLLLALRRPDLLRIRKIDLAYFALLGWVGIALNQFTYLFAISRIHVAAAILLQYLGPSLIAIYMVLVAKERLSRIILTAIVGATVGCYLVVGAYHLDVVRMNLAGILSGLLSAVTFAAYTLLSEYGMRRYNPWTVLCMAFCFGAVAWNLLLPPFSAFSGDYSTVEWGWIIYIGILGTLAPFGLYFEGISLIRSTRASITATLEPISAGIIAFVFLGEAMAFPQMLGGALVIGSVVLLQVKQEQDRNAPALLRAARRKQTRTASS